MYYTYGISGPSLLIESTDSMIPIFVSTPQRYCEIKWLCSRICIIFYSGKHLGLKICSKLNSKLHGKVNAESGHAVTNTQ